MSIDVMFSVPIIPKAAPRPRASTKNGVIRSYTPRTAQDWKRTVALAAERHMPRERIAGPVRVDVWFLLPRPQRLMRKKDPQGEVWCTSKPDRDNLDKAVLDALAPFWGDDAQVCAGTLAKVYHAKDGRPEVRVRVRAGDAVGEPADLDDGWMRFLHERAMR